MGRRLARHLGARVYGHPQGRAEIGYYPLRETGAGLSACGAALPRMVWLIELGLLLSIFLRCCMIAYMFVAAFNNVTRIMYLCPAHPLALLYAVLGTAMLCARRRSEREGAVIHG